LSVFDFGPEALVLFITLKWIGRDFNPASLLRAFCLAARLAGLAFLATDLRDLAATVRLRDLALANDLRDFAFVAFLLVFAIPGLLPNFVRGCEIATPIAACRRTVRKGSAFPEAISPLFS
jgi:hypothetical protein